MSGVTASPVGGWVVQQARNLTMVLADRVRPVRFLVRVRDAKFTGGFDEVFRCERIRIIRTPVRAPRANALAERFVGTIRRECLDRMLIFHRRQLEAVLAECVDYYTVIDRTAHSSRRHRSRFHRRRSPDLRIRHDCEDRTGLVASSTSTNWLGETHG